MRLYISMVIAGILLFSVGCAEQLKTAQLEGVAKDWCLTIRACEVMPVYPLTEDIQPGDVFLVHQSSDEEVASYSQNGFLPLRDIVARLPVSNYKRFYASRYGTANSDIPAGWQFPATAPATPDFAAAPHVAFPSFSFSVQEGTGVSASFPVYAIPVGLSLLQTSQASGTVSFGSAYTFGSDVKTIEDAAEAWASDSTNKMWLQHKVQSLSDQSNDVNGIAVSNLHLHSTDIPTFLRVVTRVYLIDKVNVSMNNTSNNAATVSGGVPKSVDLGNLSSTDVAGNYTAVNNLLQTAAAGAPGGTLKLAVATGRSVSLESTFDRPLVMGYLCIDLEVGKDGSILSSVATMKRLSTLLKTAAVKLN